MKNQEVEQQGDSTTVLDDKQIKQFQSLYYLIKGKRDTDIKLFNENKKFNYSDIIELNEKIYRKLSLHELITDIVEVTVGLNNKEIKSFGSWAEFISTDWNISAKTKYISILWDFNLILPNQQHKVPQTHTLRVRIGNDLKPSEMIHVVFQGGEEYDLEEAQSQMSCKIDFINSQICNELKTIVADWYETLAKNSEEQKLIRFIIKNDDRLRNFLILSFITGGIILLNYLYPVLINSQKVIFQNDYGHRIFFLSTISIAILYIFYQVGILFTNHVLRKQIGKLKRNPMFNFTKGDKNRFTDVKNENEKLKKKIFLSIIIGLLVNAVSAALGYFINQI